MSIWNNGWAILVAKVIVIELLIETYNNNRAFEAVV